MLDISNPVMPVEIGWYDTYPASNNNLYQGCWGVYKFPSGKIIASDMNTGLYVLKMGKTVGINNNVTELNEFRLEQNYPNPFNPKTIINYELGNKNFVSVKVYDVLGNEVRTLVNENKPAGSYSIEFDGSDLSSGMYFYKLTTDSFNEVRKMILLK